MHVLKKFYLACFLSSWGDRMWFFALSIYFVNINKDTLIMTAINGFACNIVQILMGSTIGSLVDSCQRINIVRIALFTQNITVAITCIVVVVIMFFKNFMQVTWDGLFFYYVQGGMIILNIISNLASMTTKISIERDWVIVIAQNVFVPKKPKKNKKGESEPEVAQTEKQKLHRNLTDINSNVRRMDLSTSVLAPLFAGGIMSFVKISERFNGVIISALFFAVWNIVSLFFEHSLLTSVYNSVPQLKKTETESKEKKMSAKYSFFQNLYKGWFVYFKQGMIVMPSLALAVLYLTVLSFDSITIGYAEGQHLGETLISILQAVGSISGVLGTFAFQAMHNRCKLSLRLIGMIGSIYQFIFLIGCFSSIWLPGSPFEVTQRIFNYQASSNCTTAPAISKTSENAESMPGSNVTEIITTTAAAALNATVTQAKKGKFFKSDCHNYTHILVLLISMAVSRFGLWMLDMAINQQIQESVKEKERGIVGGVQGSLNKIFDLIKYAAVIGLPKMYQYGYLVIMSFCAVFSAFCLYTSFVVISTFCIKQSPHEASEDAEDQAEASPQELEKLNDPQAIELN